MRMLKARERGIREYLMIPLVLFITLSPLFALFVFNIGITMTVRGSVNESLRNTAFTSYEQMNIELKTFMKPEEFHNIEKTEYLRRILHNNRRFNDIEMYIFDNSKNLVMTTSYKESKEHDILVEQVILNIPDMSIDNVTNIVKDDIIYAFVGYNASGMYFSESAYIVFLAPYNYLETVTIVINIALLMTIASGVVAALIITKRISVRIENYMNELNTATEKIGAMEEYTVKNNFTIKEIKTLSENIADMALRLRNYDVAQKAFLQNISHEIKNPLMAIQGYAEGIQEGLFDEPQDAGKIIKEESTRLNYLINGLLTLTKIENQQYKKEYETMDINDSMREYIKILEGVAIKEKKKIKARFSDEKLMVKINDDLLYHCVINISSNAIRYAKETIEIKVYREGKSAIILISDDGPGFRITDKEKLFDKFYKGEKGLFGLGLTIAKESAVQLGGTVEAETTEKGARFLIKLPVAGNDGKTVT